MKRSAGFLATAVVAATLALPASSSATESFCEEHVGGCPDTRTRTDS